MAHMIYNNDFAHVNAPAWHGIGTKLPEDASLEVWNETAGFDYTIGEATVQFDTGDERIGTFDGKKVLYRSDTKAPLAVVSDGYKVVQPRDVLEFFRDLTTDLGFKMETAGVLRRGAIYFALARTNNEAMIAGSNHKQYTLLATGCDGTLATTAQLTDVRVVCNNTLRAATDSNEQQIKVKHSTTFDAANAKQRLGVLNVDKSFELMVAELGRLASYRMVKDEASTFFAELLSPNRAKAQANSLDDLLALPVSLKGGAVATDKARAIKGLEQLERDYYMAPGACPGTAYGALQAVTHYVDHSRNQNNRDGATYSALFTQGAALKDRAFAELLNRAA